MKLAFTVAVVLTCSHYGVVHQEASCYSALFGTVNMI